MKVEHQLGETWAKHAQEVLEQANESLRQAYELEGRAAEQRREAETMKKHLSVLIGQIVAAERLPPSLTPYRLSPDATKLLGEMPEPLPQPPQEPPVQEVIDGMAS